MSQVKKIPDGYHSITPILIVKNGVKAIEFYKKAFGAKERGPYDDSRRKINSSCIL